MANRALDTGVDGTDFRVIIRLLTAIIMLLYLGASWTTSEANQVLKTMRCSSTAFTHGSPTCLKNTESLS